MDEAGDAHGFSRYLAGKCGSDALPADVSAIIERVTSPLSAVAIAKRRQFAATLGLLAMLFIAVGAVSATGATTGLVKAFVVVALLVAVCLGLMAWGVLHSVRMDVAEQRLDAAIEDAVRSSQRSMCGCGVEHDPDEMHFVDGEGQHLSGRKCASDGTGADCSHSCDTCVLAAQRLQPAAAFARPADAAVRRPSPRPRRPSPLPR
jgi:hypothetical protein